MTHSIDPYDYGWQAGYGSGFAQGKREGLAQGRLATTRRDEIIANQEQTIDNKGALVEYEQAKNSELLASVSKLAKENAALSARIGELATASPKPIIGAYPVKPLGKNLKPHQPPLPKVGDSVRLIPKGVSETRAYWEAKLFIVSAVYPHLIDGVHVVSRGSGKFYNLNDYTWEVK